MNHRKTNKNFDIYKNVSLSEQTEKDIKDIGKSIINSANIFTCESHIRSNNYKEPFKNYSENKYKDNKSLKFFESINCLDYKNNNASFKSNQESQEKNNIKNSKLINKTQNNRQTLIDLNNNNIDKIKNLEFTLKDDFSRSINNRNDLGDFIRETSFLNKNKIPNKNPIEENLSFSIKKLSENPLLKQIYNLQSNGSSFQKKSRNILQCSHKGNIKCKSFIDYEHNEKQKKHILYDKSVCFINKKNIINKSSNKMHLNPELNPIITFSQEDQIKVKTKLNCKSNFNLPYLKITSPKPAKNNIYLSSNPISTDRSHSKIDIENLDLTKSIKFQINNLKDKINENINKNINKSKISYSKENIPNAYNIRDKNISDKQTNPIT